MALINNSAILLFQNFAEFRLVVFADSMWIENKDFPNRNLLKNLYEHYTVYRSCIALFYRKRLPQQNGDR